MYQLLIKLMLISALAQFGISLFEAESCHSVQCAGRIERASREVLKIEWKPISVFLKEAKRFR